MIYGGFYRPAHMPMVQNDPAKGLKVSNLKFRLSITSIDHTYDG